MATDLGAVGYKRRKGLFRVLALAYHKLTWALLPACLLVLVLAELLDCSTSIPVAKVLQKAVLNQTLGIDRKADMLHQLLVLLS